MDSAMVTSDPSPATSHPSFVVTSVYFRCVFSSSFINHNKFIWSLWVREHVLQHRSDNWFLNISRSIAECYRSHSMFARRFISIQEEWVSVVGMFLENLNLDFIVPPFFLIFWRIPVDHVRKAFCKIPLRCVTIHFARRNFSLNVNTLEFLIPYTPKFVSVVGIFLENLNPGIHSTSHFSIF